MASEIKEFLGNVRLWRGLADEQLEAIAEITILCTYVKNQLIFSEGEPGTGFFAVKSGRVKLFKVSAEGKEQILHLFGPEEHFAEVPAFDGDCFPASAIALEATELLFFPRTAFLNLLEQYPNIAINMLVIFARHLRRFAQIIEDLSFKEVPGRLAAYLLYLYGDSQILSGAVVELDMTKAQLAAFLGTIPETLSRVFAKLNQEGLMVIDGAKITLLDVKRLRMLAGSK
jgi:CRP/FNR family transcriptional regulator, dissimilatory nitrate respiration regulator